MDYIKAWLALHAGPMVDQLAGELKGRPAAELTAACESLRAELATRTSPTVAAGLSLGVAAMVRDRVAADVAG